VVLGTSNCNGKDEIQGSLHCAAHDETVSGFGRDDDCLGGVREKQATAKTKTEADPYGMTNKMTGTN
jgi:hypothetical protein